MDLIYGPVTEEEWDAWVTALARGFHAPSDSDEAERGRCSNSTRPTTLTADITLSTADLAAAYLGGPRLSLLARAGRLEGESAALGLADALFGWDLLPWCADQF